MAQAISQRAPGTEDLNMAKRPTTKLSPERAALAAEIEKGKANQANIAALEADYETARQAFRTADDLVYKLKAEIAELGDKSAETAIAAIRSGKKKVRTRAAAERDLAEALDDRETAETARDELDKQIQRDRSAAGNTWALDQLRAAVFRDSPEVTALLADVAERQAALAPKIESLLFLDVNSAIFDKPSSSGSWVPGSRDDATVQTLFRAMSPPRTWRELLEGAKNPWRQAWDALATDASAPLPQ
jgi:hypothetical protein